MVQENVVTNICVWNGDINSWVPPADATMLVSETARSKVWVLNEEKTEYVLVESVGDVSVGFTYDGTFCITNEPKPTVNTGA